MSEFVKRVSQKISKLTSDQVEKFIDHVTSENEMLDAIIESLSTGLIVCDEQWNVIQTNKAAERYIPFTQRPSEIRFAELKSENKVWDVIADEDIAAFIRITAELQKSREREEFSIGAPGGSVRYVEIRILPFVQRKKLSGSIIKIEDVTEKKNQETLLRRMESLASLTNLAASVAHEIKNPLGSISIHIQLIQKAFAKARLSGGKMPDEKYAEKYLSVINEEIERLNQIIVDFLFAVRPISATFELIDVSALLSSFADFIKPELERKKIDLELDIKKNQPHVFIDEKLFKQVIMNLVQNAIAAMPMGGTLLFSTTVQNDHLVVSVADTGTGMDEQTVERIFEPYFTTKASGTGLGLTMVYKIIKEFSGDIDVHSVPGEGTIFAVSLPIPQKEQRLIEYTSHNEREGKNHEI